MGLDEEGTLGALRGHRKELVDPALIDHGGRIANTAGDSMLLEFPSAVEAMRCMIAIQEGIAIVPGDDSHGVASVGSCIDDGINQLIAKGGSTNWKKPEIGRHSI